jgi:hypothetical protein
LLLLLCWPRWSFRLRRTGATFDLLLLSAWLLLLLLWLRSLWLLNASRFTLLLTATSLLLDARLLLLHRRRRLRGLLWRTTSLALITYLELLSLRTLRHVIHTHPVREIRPEVR